VGQLLEEVGLPRSTCSYPHEFWAANGSESESARGGGRAGRSSSVDEPVSALDVRPTAPVINLMQDLQRDRGLGYLFIAKTCRWSSTSPTASP